MNVLSLFDGMSCGQIALNRAGIAYDNYFASEIDKYAITVTQKNYPNTVQLGDIAGWHDWDLPKIDLIMGGSPCQGFSIAGKQRAFDDPRSRLFFKFVECVRHFKPRWFILENVRMKKIHLDTITYTMGVRPICINSALVSAQNRVRYYWTNIQGVEQPKDRGLIIGDILQNPKSIKAFIYKPLADRRIDGLRTGCIKIGHAELNGHDSMKRVYSTKGKCPTLTAVCGGHQERKIAVDASRWRKLTPVECERLQTVPDNYTAGVSNTQRYKMIGNGWTVDVISHILERIKEC